MQCSIYSHWNTWMKIMIVEKNYLWLCIFLWMQSSQCFRYNKEKSETYLKLSVLFSISCIADFLANHYGISKFWNLSLKGTPFHVSWGTSAFLDPYVRETPFSPHLARNLRVPGSLCKGDSVLPHLVRNLRVPGPFPAFFRNLYAPKPFYEEMGLRPTHSGTFETFLWGDGNPFSGTFETILWGTGTTSFGNLRKNHCRTMQLLWFEFQVNRFCGIPF